VSESGKDFFNPAVGEDAQTPPGAPAREGGSAERFVRTSDDLGAAGVGWLESAPNGTDITIPIVHDTSCASCVRVTVTQSFLVFVQESRRFAGFRGIAGIPNRLPMHMPIACNPAI